MKLFHWIKSLIVVEQTELVCQLISNSTASSDYLHYNSFFAIEKLTNNTFLSALEFEKERDELYNRKKNLEQLMTDSLREMLKNEAISYDKQDREKIIKLTNDLDKLEKKIECFQKDIIYYTDCFHWFLLKRISNIEYLSGLLKANSQPLFTSRGNIWWGVPKKGFSYEPYQHFEEKISNIEFVHSRGELINIYNAFCQMSIKKANYEEKIKLSEPIISKSIVPFIPSASIFDCSLKELCPPIYRSSKLKERLFEKAIRMDIPNIYIKYIEDGNPY